MFEDFSILEVNPQYGFTKYWHKGFDNEPISDKMVWPDDPEFYDESGRIDLEGEYDVHPEYGPYRLVDDYDYCQPDDFCTAAFQGRKHDNTSKSDARFRLEDGEWQDLTGPAHYSN